MKGLKKEFVEGRVNSFSEVQSFSRWWILLILISTYSVPFLLKSEDANMKILLYMTFLFGTILAAVFAITRLITEYNQEKISLRFFPFIYKEIDWSEVSECRLINYGFVGGWGLRLFTKYGTVYNISGNKGVHLKMKSGKQIVIGTQKTEEIDEVLDHICSDIYQNDL